MTTLLVSSVGGHLTELHRLLPALEGVEPERRWVTFDSPQSRSLLADEDVIYLDYTGPRDVKNILRHTGTARRLFRGRHPYSTVVSTGSGIALSFLPLGCLRSASCHYIESFTRSTGPSATGRVLSRIPGIALYAQYPGWATPPWRYAGSVFDVFRASAAPKGAGAIERVVVTLGTMEDYPFRRLIERALAVLPPEVEVLWQTGCTDVSDLPIDGRVQLPAHELREAVANADAVIAHAGCGSALAALEAGKMPVLVPRLAAHGENVDDHQLHLVQELRRRGLAVVRSVEELTLEDLELAALSRVQTSRNGAPFELRS
jgi:UDP-N-acetylglucosamine--N-acetylmuramyl-(pentapeptide) pyrophosphoryl-undecaprenol N-acetylglucosamine transferase